MTPERELARQYRKNAFIVIGCALFAVAIIIVASLLNGCAASNPATLGKVNETTTEVIADAGVVAIQAEAAYQSGTLPQTAAARNAINDLGTAYNQAKQVWQGVLAVESALSSASTNQIAACQPATSTATGAGATGATTNSGATTSGCQAATAAVAAAQTALTSAQQSLSASITALATKTSAVKALSGRP